MWYTGNDGADQRIGYATSSDGVDWTKDANNPVLDLGSAGSWDDVHVFIPWVIDDGSTFHMWYTGNDGTNLLRIGYATDTSRVVGIEDYSSIIPSSFVLHQNYPNPFNPISTIRYDLPQGGEVSLIVYNILGREVARLVDGYMEPGYHQVQWDGMNNSGRELPSGIYITRLVTPEYTKSIKMVLLK